MSQLGELLNKLATQSGVDANDESLKALLSNPTIASYEVPETIVTSLTNNLMTVESAKNNPTIKNHFFATALNGVDSELNNLTTKYGFEQGIIDELNAEKSSTKRVGLMISKIQELESAKANTGGGDKAALQEVIDKLHLEMKTQGETHASALDTQTIANRENIKGMLVNNLLSGYEYSLPVDKAISINTANQLINQEVNKLGAKVVLTDNNELQLTTSDGMDVFNGNDKMNFKGLVETTLANNKLLKTKEPIITPPAGTPPAGGGRNEFLEAATTSAAQFDE